MRISFTLALLTISLVCLGSFAQSPRPPAIASISVCSPTGSGGQGSCPSGSFDTHHIVLAPDGSGNAINRYEAGSTSDEHSSVFSPGMLGTNNDYLFFVGSGTNASGGIGTAVLSGGAGPDKNGQWTFDIPKADGYGSYPIGFAQVFRQPFPEGKCPLVADGNPAHQDQTFDLDYAAPGSVVKDPTSAVGSLIMVYEGTNTCVGDNGGSKTGSGAYEVTAIATSVDYGRNWATYRGTPTFAFVPMPGANKTQGPNGPSGAVGKNVCMGNDCITVPPAAYGRYPVLTPPTSLATVMAAGQPLNGNMGDSQVAAFLDDANASPAPYLYIVHSYLPGSNSSNDLAVARAQLNGGAPPLNFSKWNGQSFSTPGIGGAEGQLLPNGTFQSCGGSVQMRSNGSISYVEDTQQYLLFFTCNSPSDPASGPGGGHQGSAWFYSTTYDLSDPTQWTTPQEITGSWSEWDTSGGCPSYKGWYPTLMSLGGKPGHLSTSGYSFYLWGCEGGAGDPSAPKRQFSSREFIITTSAQSPPQIFNGGTVNNASYTPGTNPVAPGSIAAIFGSNLTDGTSCLKPNCNPTFGNDKKLGTTLAGAQVAVNGTPAPIFYAAPGQLGIQIPFEAAGTSANVVVSIGGQKSPSASVAISPTAPGIFTVTSDGKGAGAITHADGSTVTAQNPAKRGEVVILYATGLGQVRPAVPTGMVPTGASSTVAPVTLSIGGIGVSPDFSGLAGCCVGLNQINFRVPPGVAPGNSVSVELTIGGKSANPVTMAVQ